MENFVHCTGYLWYFFRWDSDILVIYKGALLRILISLLKEFNIFLVDPKPRFMKHLSFKNTFHFFSIFYLHMLCSIGALCILFYLITLIAIRLGMFILFRWGNCTSEILSKLPKFIWVISGTEGIWIIWASLN